MIVNAPDSGGSDFSGAKQKNKIETALIRSSNLAYHCSFRNSENFPLVHCHARFWRCALCFPVCFFLFDLDWCFRTTSRYLANVLVQYSKYRYEALSISVGSVFTSA